MSNGVSTSCRIWELYQEFRNGLYRGYGEEVGVEENGAKRNDKLEIRVTLGGVWNC